VFLPNGDAKVPHGDALLGFADAVTLGSFNVSDARAAVLTAVGAEGLAEAAGTVALFRAWCGLPMQQASPSTTTSRILRRLCVRNWASIASAPRGMESDPSGLPGQPQRAELRP
jgi:hypothetical protein